MPNDRHVVAMLVAATVIACGGGGGNGSPTPPANTTPVLTTLSVALAPATIEVGQTATATVMARDQFGAAIAAGTVTWSSSSQQVATVTGAGSVRGVGVGQSNIGATVGMVTASAPIVVRAAATDIATCKLPAKFPDLGLGFPRVVNRQKAVGDVRVAVVFVDFSDAVATRTPQTVFAIISPTAENYYRTISYSRMNLILQPSFFWRRMSKADNRVWLELTHLQQPPRVHPGGPRPRLLSRFFTV